MTQQMSPRADNFFQFYVSLQSEDFFQSLRGITPSKFIVSEPYTKGWKDEKGQHNMPRPIYDGSILKFTIYCIPRLFVEWWKSWSFFENKHIKCDWWRDWMERLDGETEDEGWKTHCKHFMPWSYTGHGRE